jgi:hypothetical protein
MKSASSNKPEVTKALKALGIVAGKFYRSRYNDGTVSNPEGMTVWNLAHREGRDSPGVYGHLDGELHIAVRQGCEELANSAVRALTGAGF